MTVLFVGRVAIVLLAHSNRSSVQLVPSAIQTGQACAKGAKLVHTKMLLGQQVVRSVIEDPSVLRELQDHFLARGGRASIHPSQC